MADWSGYTQAPNYQGLVQSNANAQQGVFNGMDTAFNQGMARDQNARAWDANTRANIESDQNQQLFPYKLDDARMANAVKAQAMLNEYGGMAQDVQGPEEWNLLKSTMQQRGIDTSRFDNPDWQIGRRNLQIMTADTQRRLAQEMQKANIAEKLAQGQNFSAEAISRNPILQQQIATYKWQVFKAMREGREPPQPPWGNQVPTLGQGAQTVAPQQQPPTSSGIPGIAVQTAPASSAQVAPPTNPVNPYPGLAFERTGDTTASGGAIAPGRGFVPDLISPEDEAMLYWSINGDPHTAQIMKDMPGARYRMKAADQRAIDDTQRTNLQLNAQGPLGIMRNWIDYAASLGPDVLSKATGPYMNREDFQRIRSSLNPSDQTKWDQAYEANLRMQHLAEVMGAQMKALGGSGGATDQQQQIIMDAVAKALKSGTPENFFAIMHDAMNGVRSLGRIPPEQEPEDLIPKSWRDRGYKSKPVDDWRKPPAQSAKPTGGQIGNSPQAQVPQDLPYPKSQQEYDELEVGRKYIGKDGKTIMTKGGQSSL